MKEQTIIALENLASQLQLLGSALTKEPMLTLDYESILYKAAKELKNVLSEENLD